MPSLWSPEQIAAGLAAILVTCFAAPAGASTGSKAATPDLAGTTWLTEKRSGIVRLESCGANQLCGTIVRVLPPEPADATDRNNPDPALRSRTVQGLRILSDFKPGREGTWRDGRIYNPEDGRSYRSHLRRAADGRLIVSGCVGPLCLTQNWTPARP